MKKTTLRGLLGVLFCFISSTQLLYGQDHGIGITGTLEMPLGDMKDIYKPTAGVELGYSTVDDLYNNRLVYSVGYHQYTPKEEMFIYQVEEGEYGKAEYSDFKVITLGAEFIQEWGLTDRFEPYAGLKLAYYLPIYEVSLQDKYMNLNKSSAVTNAAFSPTVGLMTTLSDYFELNVNARYNWMLPLGENVGVESLQTLTVGLGLIYVF